MATPEDRRRQQIGAIATLQADCEMNGLDVTPDVALDALMIHFEATDQKPVADAIRLGLTKSFTPEVFHCGRDDHKPRYCKNCRTEPLYGIDRPATA